MSQANIHFFKNITIKSVLIGSFAVAIMSYAFQGLAPALNSDDISAIQFGLPNLLRQGRWASYFLFDRLLDFNSIPGLSTFIGVALLITSCWSHARLMNLREPVAILSLCLVSSISVYYGLLFDFDFTRIFGPLSSAVSSAGLVLVFHRSGKFGIPIAVLMLAFGIALYQAALMYQVTLLFSSMLLWAVRDGTRQTIASGFRGLSAIMIGVIIYILSTSILYGIAGYSLDDRTTLNLYGIVDNWNTLKGLFFGHSFPVISGFYHFTSTYNIFIWMIYCLFWLTLTASAGGRISALRWGFAAVCFASLVVSPYFLIVVSKTDYYPARSLYSFAAVHGALLAIAIETLMTSISIRKINVLLPISILFVSLFVLLNAVGIGKYAFDQYLASQSDMATINRIIFRIDEVIAESLSADEFTREGAKIPLVVVGDISWQSGPRPGGLSTWMHNWSKENVFRLIDPRFVAAPGSVQNELVEATRAHRRWPAKDSVFVENGIVVVVR